MTDKQYKSQKAIAEAFNLVLTAILNDKAEYLDITKNALIISELLKADEITKAFEIVAEIERKYKKTVSHHAK
ncbi:MAG: hypothetical protein J6L23_04585 [Clostridia bacterium]|nr:hypothetical protein [Clostridia bacterium]